MSRLLHSQSHLVIADPRPADYRDLALLAGEHLWHVHFLTSGNAALQFARRGRWDLWIVNSELSDMSGFDLFEMLRDMGVGRAVFVVADRYSAEAERTAYRAGTSLFLCKDASGVLHCKPLLETLLAEMNRDPFARSTAECVGRQTTVARAADAPLGGQNSELPFTFPGDNR